MHTLTLHYHHNNHLIATAHLTKSSRPMQSQGVRKLLAWCLVQFFPTYQLNDTTHPYRLVSPDKPALFVSFSHSKEKVALIIAPTPCGIDIELRPISQQIAERFFHANELSLLNSLSHDKQHTTRLTLWQLKECLVKAQNSTLAQVISQDMTPFIQSLQNMPMQGAECGVYWLWQMDFVVAVVKKYAHST